MPDHRPSPDQNLARRARRATGLNQAELAKLLGIGQPLLSRWENGARMSAASTALMRVIERAPEGVKRVLDARPRPNIVVRARLTTGLSQHEFAHLLGVPPDDVIRWETGKIAMRATELFTVRAILNDPRNTVRALRACNRPQPAGMAGSSPPPNRPADTALG